MQSVLAAERNGADRNCVGQGTTFRLRLPLTLAIIRALLFRVEQRLYALPLNAVAEIARTVEENIHQVEHYDVLQLRNDVLPLLRLGQKPAEGPETARRKVFILVINSGERKFGLVVDELEGEEELVIKALDDQSITTDLVSGASILRWQGGSYPEHDRPHGSLHARARGCRWSRMAGLLSSCRIGSGQRWRIQTDDISARGTAGGQA